MADQWPGPAANDIGQLVGAYLLRGGEPGKKAVAIYSRCKEESYCRAELALLLERVEADPRCVGMPVYGYYDVDPTLTVQKFLKGYRKRGRDKARLLALREEILRDGWNFSETDEPRPAHMN